MEYLSFEPEEIQPSLSWSSSEYDVSLPNRDCFFNSGGYHQEGLFGAVMPLLRPQENETIFNRSSWAESSESEEDYEGVNWLRQCDSIFSYSWQEMDDNSEKTDCSNPSEEHCESRFGCEDEYDESYHEARDYDPWSFCASWFGYGDKRIGLDYGQEESDAAAYERGMREVAVYEGIIGYWPCLYQRKHFSL